MAQILFMKYRKFWSKIENFGENWKFQKITIFLVKIEILRKKLNFWKITIKKAINNDKKIQKIRENRKFRK